MENFREFFENPEHIRIDIAPEHLLPQLPQLEKVNDDLDTVTLPVFVNSAVFVNTVRGTLERYGIILPAHSQMQQLDLEGEWVYELGDSGYFVYMVHNLNDDGAVEGYATICDEEELEDLLELGSTEDNDEDIVEPIDQPRRRLPPASRDDDSGNTNEYT